MTVRNIEYIAPPTLSKFHLSDAFYRGIMGPVGSGKSTACCWEIMSRAHRQEPDGNGKRKTRWAVVRNTYRQLEDTTVRTWQDWFSFGKLSDMNQIAHFKLDDGTIVELEILFRALDRPQDVKKLLSLELTGAWINEAREVPKGIVDGLGDRVGRYPSKRDGGCSWRGVIMDTNPPDDDHWWYQLAETDRPDNWQFFRQPGGLLEVNGKWQSNPKAENIANLEDNYYLSRIGGKDPDYIRVYYCAQYGFVKDGKPVFPEYVDAVHCSQDILQPVKKVPIYIGVDFGLTPAAVFGQRLPSGRWQWFDELVTEDMGAVRFSEVLQQKIAEYPGFEFDIYGDPAGDQRSQVDERTPFQILRANGINCSPAPTNDAMLRREAIAVPLSRLIDGKPGLMVSPKCATVRKGLAGGYCYKRIQVSGERYQDKPDKNKYSHPLDAAGYLMMGAGEGRALVASPLKKDKIMPFKYNLSNIGRQSWM